MNWKKSEEKPEHMKNVLGLFPDRSYDIVCWDSEGETWWSGDGDMFDDEDFLPIYWQELPEPPK
jgi:hypothetical protein